jgi:hypothetical protein
VCKEEKRSQKPQADEVLDQKIAASLKDAEVFDQFDADDILQVIKTLMV